MGISEDACAVVMDHCKGQPMVAQRVAEGLEGGWDKEFRRKTADWLVEKDWTRDRMVDIVRRFYMRVRNSFLVQWRSF